MFLAYWVGLGNASAVYDPGVQRWLSREPLTDTGSTVFDQMPQRLSFIVFLRDQRVPNGYEFVRNDPVIYVDYFGLQIWQGPGTPAPPNPTIPCNNCPPGQKSMTYWQINNYPSLTACMADISPISGPAGIGIGIGLGGAGIWGIAGGPRAVGGTATTIGLSVTFLEIVAMNACLSQSCH